MSLATTSVYAPDFEVNLDGHPLPAELRGAVTGVRFEEAFEGADRVELQLANAGLLLLDHPLLELRTPVRLALGYRPGQLTEVFTGTVTGVEPTFPSGAMPSITLSAHDHMRRLMEGTKQRGFPWYLTDTVIAAIVAAESRLLIATDPAAAVLGGLGLFDERPRFQHRQSDHDLLRQIAAQYGIDMWVDGDRLNFRVLQRGQTPVEVELHWGASLLDFTPRLTSIGQILAVNFRLWIQALKMQLTVSVGYDGERVNTRIFTGVPPAELQRTGSTLELPDQVLDSPAEAIRYAVGELRRRINNRTTGQGSAVGDPRLRAGRVIGLTGLGRRFSGEDYRLTSVAHSLDGNGYRTTFTVRKEVI